MVTILLSFLAGILTVAAPCSLPVLPIILGSSAAERNLRKPLTVIVSLCLSIFAFTLLLKASTLFIMVPNSFWQYLSGGLITLIGISFVLPNLWEKISHTVGLSRLSNRMSTGAQNQEGFWKDVMIGASLMPILAICSPTYTYVIATFLPQSLVLGLTNLLVYTLGLALTLGLIALLGNAATSKLKFMADPQGWFRKALGIIMLIVGVMIMTGWMKQLETQLLQAPVLDVVRFEIDLLNKVR